MLGITDDSCGSSGGDARIIDDIVGTDYEWYSDGHGPGVLRATIMGGE
jgi:hypothetical protein